MNLIFKSILFTLPLLFFACQGEESANKNTPEAEVHVNSDFTEIENALSVEKQTFTISSDQDTLIRGAKGTLLFFPKGSLATADGQPVEGEVTLTLEECYTLSDFIGEKLTTTADGELLETGGMINITARQGSVELQLAKDKEMGVYFPRGEIEQEDMELFTGSRSEVDSIMNWEPREIITPDEISGELESDALSDLDKYSLYVNMHSGLEGNKSGTSWKFENSTETIFSYIKDYPFSQEFLARNYTQNTTYRYNLAISPEGKVIEIENTYQDESEVDILLKEILRELPPLDTSSVNISEGANPQNILGFSINYNANEDEEKKRIEEKVVSFSDQLTDQISEEELNYYVFAAAELGWINCDRFWKNPKPKIDFYVQSEGKADTRFYLVFDRIKSMMAPQRLGEKTYFANIPEGESVKIIGIQYRDDIPYLATQKTNSGIVPFSLDGFEPFTLEELQIELNQVN